ncbi:NAD-dependent epimerase/dehydratase family protein [Streptomyces sp. NPDC057740]|uniref:NAD-dependent epimerase/dehydratase family protein n=1 Tax=Streptomyces sp. NPDC057740 TaxID=3346234 RepID=UPI00368A4415
MRALATGGSGFLGRESCRQLVARGTTVSSRRRPSPAPESLDIRQHQGDLADPSAVSRALAGCDAVVHNAALAGVSGPSCRTGTPMCRAPATSSPSAAPTGSALVHTSTASVVFQPGGLRNADGSCPYPERHLAAYLPTKARAEALVPAADGPGLAAVALRPHIIWGPGDPHFAPALARAVRAGRLVMPGEGANLVDTTPLRTAAHAHLLALDRLRQGGPLSEAAPTSSPRTTPAPCRSTWCTVPTAPARAAAATRENVLRLTGRTRTHALSRFRSPSKPASRRSTEPLSPAIPWASRVAHQIGHVGGRVGGSAAVVDDVPDGPGAAE